MKKIQLLSVVFSLIMFTGVTAGTAIAFAESDDDDHDFDDRLENFCEMTDAKKEQLFIDHPRLVSFEERLTSYCELDEMEREDLIDEFIEENFTNYVEQDDWDMDDILDRYCEMSTEDKAGFLEKYPMASDHQEKMEEYCSLDESERDAFIEEHKDDYMKHDYDKRAMMDKFCELSEEDRTAHLEEYQKSKDHLVTMEEYCSLDESERDAFIEEHKDSMKGQMPDHKDSMKGQMPDHKDSMKGEMSTHSDSMKSTKSDHKNSMSSQLKSHMILKASTLTDEQKDEIKAVHEELRGFKHSLRDNSMSDSEKQDMRDQFVEKAKEFSMTWLSPRHQVAAGIDANMVECRQGFALVMKTSNASPMCVKETTAEKLIERGIVISST